MRFMSSLLYAFWAIWLVAADTEIRNFNLPLSGVEKPLGSIAQTTPRLVPSIPQTINISSKPPEQHFILSFPKEERDGGSWTVRLSWPGSSPTKWTMDISPVLNMPDSAVLHITASPLSPRVPWIDWRSIKGFLPPQLAFLDPLLDRLSPSSSVVETASTSGGGSPGALEWRIDGLPIFGTLFNRFTSLPSLFSFLPNHSSAPSKDVAEAWKAEKWETTFSIILEPLYFGVLPKSSVRAAAFALVFAIGAWMLVPFIIRTLEGHTSIIDESVWEAEEEEFKEKEMNQVVS